MEYQTRQWFSSDQLADAINQLGFMSFLILSGRLCLHGIEGTLFALNRFEKVEFACGFNDFVQAVQNPDEYPSLQYQVMEVDLYLDDWWLVFEHPLANKGSFLVFLRENEPPLHHKSPDLVFKVLFILLKAATFFMILLILLKAMTFRPISGANSII
ncbi:hypothetical protein YC2023_047381 [Brassica napus]